MTGPVPSGWQSRRGRFLEWAESIDPGVRRSLGGPFGWLGAAAAYTALLLIVGASQRLDRFFQLELPPILGLQLLSLAATLAFDRTERWRPLAPAARGAALLGIALLFQLALSATVTFSEPPGAFAFAALPLIGGCFHGFVLRPTPRHFYPVVAHALGMAAALALRPDPTHIVLFASVAPLVLGGTLVSGFIAARLAEQEGALDQFRSAIRAQVLAARRAEVEQLSDVLERALALRAAGRMALEESLRGAETLLDAPLPEGGGEPSLRERIVPLQQGVHRLAEFIEKTRQLGRDVPAPAADLESVGAFPLAREVIRALRERYPHVAFSCRATSRRAELAAASVGGGAASLRRLLSNVVANACEGDGVHGASSVELTVAAEPEVRLLAIEVRDDGPGFPPALLTAPIAPFATTKPSGSGLGLYTAERLARASGGLLRRENADGGGARVAVFLPEAPQT